MNNGFNTTYNINRNNPIQNFGIIFRPRNTLKHSKGKK